MEAWKGLTVLSFFLGFVVAWYSIAIGLAMIIFPIGIWVVSAVWHTSGTASDWVDKHA